MMTRIWRSRELLKKTKIKIRKMIQSIFLYGSKCWTKEDEKRIFTAEMSWWKITGISKLQKIRNDDIRQALGIIRH